ncbi:hypothetical protein AJ88_29970 [Mesorhizobium amorphae CCBAU 01583]|nr:hypothetical protein AJ88_29970 [Mesorhizobium amorphae CCBAU 01583]
MCPFQRRLGNDHNRRSGKGPGLDRQQRIVGQSALEGRVDQIVAGPFEVVQQRSGPALGRRQRRKQLIGLVEHFQSDRGRLKLTVTRCHLLGGRHIAPGNP